MNGNLILRYIVIAMTLCFSFSCKHAVTSATLATPEALKQDCIGYAGLDERAGYVDDFEGASYWDLERIIQFANGKIERDGAYDYLVNGENKLFSQISTRDISSLDEATLDSIKIKCKQLNLQNPSKEGLVALFASGELVSGKMECVFDIFDCNEETFVKSYSKIKQESLEQMKLEQEQEKIKLEQNQKAKIVRFRDITYGSISPLISNSTQFYSNYNCWAIPFKGINTEKLVKITTESYGTTCETICSGLFNAMSKDTRKSVADFYSVCTYSLPSSEKLTDMVLDSSTTIYRCGTAFIASKDGKYTLNCKGRFRPAEKK